jgi:hypothetical protein
LEKFLRALTEALAEIREPRFFATERGYQGALGAALERRLPRAKFPRSPILEHEHQKTAKLHKTTIRPDIIVHVPFDRGATKTRAHGNFVAIELKRRASAGKAREDFRSLLTIKRKLRYPLTIFINIDSSKTHADICPREIANQTVCFAVRLEDGAPAVRVERCG